MKANPKKKPARRMPPRKSAVKTEVADSMRQAESLWKIPLTVMKVAKASGCPAFEKSRVHRAELERWLKKHPEVQASAKATTDAAELRRQKLQEEVLLIRAKNRRETRITIPMSEALAETARFIAIVQEEAKALLDPTAYRVFCTRIKTRTGEFNP